MTLKDVITSRLLVGVFRLAFYSEELWLAAPGYWGRGE
jgi:hypothetical protein